MADLPGREPGLALALWCTFPAGDCSTVLRRNAVRQHRLGPGFLLKQAKLIVKVLYVDILPEPVPLDFVYVGNGTPGKVHPSPWLNPFASSSTSSSQAVSLFRAYATDRADFVEWIAPLFGKSLLAECGQMGAHTETLKELIAFLAGAKDEKDDLTHDPNPKSTTQNYSTEVKGVAGRGGTSCGPFETTDLTDLTEPADLYVLAQNDGDAIMSGAGLARVCAGAVRPRTDHDPGPGPDVEQDKDQDLAEEARRPRQVPAVTMAGGAVPTASHLTLPAVRGPSGGAPGGPLGFSWPSADIPVQHRIGPDHIEWSNLAASIDQGAGWNPIGPWRCGCRGGGFRFHPIRGAGLRGGSNEDSRWRTTCTSSTSSTAAERVGTGPTPSCSTCGCSPFHRADGADSTDRVRPQACLAGRSGGNLPEKGHARAA